MEKKKNVQANMINISIPPHELELLRDKAWEEVNSDYWKENRRELIVAEPE